MNWPPHQRDNGRQKSWPAITLSNMPHSATRRSRHRLARPELVGCCIIVFDHHARSFGSRPQTADRTTSHRSGDWQPRTSAPVSVARSAIHSSLPKRQPLTAKKVVARIPIRMHQRCLIWAQPAGGTPLPAKRTICHTPARAQSAPPLAERHQVQA